MGALISELATYLIKFIIMIACAVFGFIVGAKIRKNKNTKLAAQDNQK